MTSAFSWSPFPRGGGGVSDYAGTGVAVRAAGAWQKTFVSPGYVSGNWYPADFGLSVSSGTAYAANTIYFAPLVIYQDVTITDLAAEITTAVAASNFQLAIYAMDATTKRPTGAALTSTSNMSGAATTSVGSTLASPVVLAAGLWWAAVNSDSAIGLRTVAQSQGWIASLVGSATLGNIAKSAPGVLGYRVAQTFGTWPTVSPAGLTENTAVTSYVFVSDYKAQ